jgi:hypothetical protein
VGRWKVAFALDSLREFEAKDHHGAGVWIASSYSDPWIRGELGVADSALTEGWGEQLFTDVDLDFRAVTPYSFSCYKSGASMLEVRTVRDSLYLFFTPTVADCGVVGIGRLHEDSIVGTWVEGSFGGPIHKGRLRMERLPSRTE